MRAYSVSLMRTHPDGSKFGERHFFCDPDAKRYVAEYAQLEEEPDDLPVRDYFNFTDERNVEHGISYGPVVLDKVKSCETCGLGLDKRGYVIVGQVRTLDKPACI